MTLYAVHYAWIDGHAAKGPVGIWAKGGVSYYPVRTKKYEGDGSQAKTEAAEMRWEHWLEKRSEWGSTYGASWGAIDSEESMESIIEALQEEFFSADHTNKVLEVPTLHVPASEDDFLQGDGDDVEDDEIESTLPTTPSPRFVLSQSWWIAAELVRRNPNLMIHEMHPVGGSYDVLGLFTLPMEACKSPVMLNRSGSIQVRRDDGQHGDAKVVRVASWNDVMTVESPHDIVKVLEQVSGRPLDGNAPPSTPRALAYRFIATALAVAVNDRHLWDARNEFIDSSGDWWPGDPETNGYLTEFPQVREDYRSTPVLEIRHEPESHFWALLRGDETIAIVSIEGRVYLGDRHVDLADEYIKTGRRMTAVVATVLGEFLP